MVRYFRRLAKLRHDKTADRIFFISIGAIGIYGIHYFLKQRNIRLWAETTGTAPPPQPGILDGILPSVQQNLPYIIAGLGVLLVGTYLYRKKMSTPSSIMGYGGPKYTKIFLRE